MFILPSFSRGLEQGKAPVRTGARNMPIGFFYAIGHLRSCFEFGGSM